jgi:hypothetical protein
MQRLLLPPVHRFLSFFTDAFFPHFNKMVEIEILIMEIQQNEEIFSIVSEN